jgi:hypothetical protein
MKEHALHALPPLERIIAVPARAASVVLKYLHRKSRTSLPLSPKILDGSVSMHRGKGLC